eukprot:11003508-Alexandrium_andersonii.AAC.1
MRERLSQPVVAHQRRLEGQGAAPCTSAACCGPFARKGLWVGGQGAELAWPNGLKLTPRPSRGFGNLPAPVGRGGPVASGPVWRVRPRVVLPPTSSLGRADP